jgi:cysteine synthase
MIRPVPGGRLILGGMVEGGSLKHRLMDALLEEADLPAGSLVADLSAGSGALALAQTARRRKLSCRVYVTETAPAEAVAAMREAEAEVRLCPPTMEALTGALTELALGHRDKEFYWTRQNYQTYDAYRGLAEGLSAGRPDHLVAGVGTGSSLCSFGRFFRERNPSLKVHAILSSNLGGLRPPGMTLDFAGLRDVGSPEALRGLFGDQLQTYTLSRQHHADSTQAVLHVMQGLQNAVGISIDGR